MMRTMPARTAVIVQVELPPELAALRDAHDPMAARGVPPHVTVLFPFLPAAALDSTVLNDLRRLVAATPKFTANFARAERLRELVWLLPHVQDPFLRLTAAVYDRWPQHPPYEGLIEELVAHLTVVESGEAPILDRAFRVAQRVLPFQASVSELALIEEDEAGMWHHKWSVPLV
jgi:hypothetical protein